MIGCLSHLRFSYRITLVRTRMDWSRQFCFYSSETSQISLILSLKRMTTLYLLLAFLVGCRINDITTLTQAGYGQHVNSMDLSTVQPSTDRGIESAASIFPGSSLVSNNSGHVGEKPGGSSRSNGSLVMDRVIGDNMPSVFTKGDGPNGKIVEGFLYKYKKVEEVRIVCVCHGIFLTPAEFIKHAGGTDVAHPLRHIVVKPSASLL